MTSAATTAAEQLRRLLIALPALADDKAHPIAEIAERVGVSEQVLRRDLADLVTRVTDEPGGFTEGVSLLLATDTVQFQTSGGHFRRPMALSQQELQALELGLAMLAQESPPDERAAMHRARERLQRALAVFPAAAGGEREASLGHDSDARRERRQLLQRCIRERRVARIVYQGATQTDAEPREVHPLGLVWSRGQWYLVAWCLRNDGLRVFRCDRVLKAEDTAARFRAIDGFSIEDVLRDGKVLVGESGQTVRVQYTARIARWLVERGAAKPLPDGSAEAVLESHLDDWAVRHALRYGPDAEVLEPKGIREAVVAALHRVLVAHDA